MCYLALKLETPKPVSVIHRPNQRRHFLLCARLFTLIIPHCPRGIIHMHRSLTATDVSFIGLQSAVFCVQCEMLSENNTPRCLACGSGAVSSLSRVLGGSLRKQQTAHLIADAELGQGLVRSLLHTVPQVAEAGENQDEYLTAENLELPAAATFSTRHEACGLAIMDRSPLIIP